MKKKKTGTVLGGALLIAGTSIGAGMLALPVFACKAGFFPTVAIYLFCWLFMVATGLLIMEVSLWNKGETNLVSMATSTLGNTGKYMAWLLYAFLFYSLNVAYVSEGGNYVLKIIGLDGYAAFAPIIFVLIFSPIVFIGAFAVDKCNEVLMGGLVLSYIAFFALGLRYVDFDGLAHVDWSWSLLSMPIAITSFGFHNIVPTLTTYLEHDVKKIRKAILIGASLPFFFYVVWNWLVMGIVPLHGEGGLLHAYEVGSSSVGPLLGVLRSNTVIIASSLFAFCALLTSFLGVSLGFVDFLADGLTVKKTVKGRLLLSSCVFIPPIVIAMSYPGMFLKALKKGGGFGGILLLGLLPIMMVWAGRKNNRDAPYKFCGGKGLLVLMIVFVIFELIVDYIY